MNQGLLLAGATGAIGRRLVPLLLRDGHRVYGTTRSADKAEQLRAAGVEPIVVDVFDALALSRVMLRMRPAAIVHQLTDLPPGLDPARMADAVAKNARVRTEGTANLIAAALDAGVQRIVAQSIAWAYASGPMPHREDDPLDLQASGPRATTVGAVAALERAVLHSPPLKGVVLRYGQLYGPGTGRDAPGASTMPLHVDAAAWATVLALRNDECGIFNIAEGNTEVSSAKARAVLGWNAAWRPPEDRT